MKTVARHLKSYIKEIVSFFAGNPRRILLAAFYFFTAFTFYRLVDQAYILQDVGFAFGDYAKLKSLISVLVILHLGLFLFLKLESNSSITVLSTVIALSLGLPNVVLGLISVFFSRLAAGKKYYYLIPVSLLLLILFDYFARIEEGLISPVRLLGVLVLFLLTPYLASSKEIKKK